jgi:hypothetical protein
MDKVAAPNSASGMTGFALAGGLHVGSPRGPRFQAWDRRPTGLS